VALGDGLKALAQKISTIVSPARTSKHAPGRTKVNRSKAEKKLRNKRRMAEASRRRNRKS
jgi:hypothetical protein